MDIEFTGRVYHLTQMVVVKSIVSANRGFDTRCTDDFAGNDIFHNEQVGFIARRRHIAAERFQ